MQKLFLVSLLILVFGLSACAAMQPVVITATPAPTNTAMPTPAPTFTATPTFTPSPTSTVTPTATPTATPTPTLELPAGWSTPIPVPMETITADNVERLTLLARYNQALVPGMNELGLAGGSHLVFDDNGFTIMDVLPWESKVEGVGDVFSMCHFPGKCEQIPVPDTTRLFGKTNWHDAAIWQGQRGMYLVYVEQDGLVRARPLNGGEDVSLFRIGDFPRIGAGYIFEDYGFVLYELQFDRIFKTYLRNLHTGQILTFENSLGYYPPSYADGIVAWTNGNLYVLDLNKNGAIITRVKWSDGAWGRVAGHPVVLPGGDLVAYVLSQGQGSAPDISSLRIIDPQHAHVVAELSTAYESVLDVSPDGRLLLAYADQRVHVLDAETGESLFDIPYVSADFRKRALFSPDGRYLITTTATTVEVWGIWP